MENNDINIPPIESQQSNEVSEDSKNQKICDALEVVAYSISTIIVLAIFVALVVPVFVETLNNDWYKLVTQWVLPIAVFVGIGMVIISNVIARKKNIKGCKVTKIILLPLLISFLVVFAINAVGYLSFLLVRR